MLKSSFVRLILTLLIFSLVQRAFASADDISPSAPSCGVISTLFHRDLRPTLSDVLHYKRLQAIAKKELDEVAREEFISRCSLEVEKKKSFLVLVSITKDYKQVKRVMHLCHLCAAPHFFDFFRVRAFDDSPEGIRLRQLNYLLDVKLPGIERRLGELRPRVVSESVDLDASYRDCERMLNNLFSPSGEFRLAEEGEVCEAELGEEVFGRFTIEREEDDERLDLIRRINWRIAHILSGATTNIEDID